jgi:hypothetical protein
VTTSEAVTEAATTSEAVEGRDPVREYAGRAEEMRVAAAS